MYRLLKPKNNGGKMKKDLVREGINFNEHVCYAPFDIYPLDSVPGIIIVKKYTCIDLLQTLSIPTAKRIDAHYTLDGCRVYYTLHQGQIISIDLNPDASKNFQQREKQRREEESEAGK